jgi:hypothetical protein
MSIQSQIMYQLIINNIGPILSSVVSSAYTSYKTLPHSITQLVRTEVDDERELDLLQMDRLLKWMKMVFDTSTIQDSVEEETRKAYKKELYNIYVTIVSDYKQYEDWKRYNSSLWLLSTYRNKNTKALAKKILADVKLFNEGLKMFSMFEKL